MTTHIKISGVWQPVTQPYVKISGVWQPCTQVYIKNSGVWEPAWSGVTGENVHLGTYTGVNSSSFDLRTSTGGITAIAGWTFKTDGNMLKWEDNVNLDHSPTPDEWYDGTVDGTYYIKFTLTAGSAANNISPAVGTWGVLTSQRSFYHSQSVSSGFPYFRNGTYQVDISTSASDANIVETGSYKYNIAIDSGQ